jgi:hypothetical protein
MAPLFQISRLAVLLEMGGGFAEGVTVEAWLSRSYGSSFGLCGMLGAFEASSFTSL